MPVGIDEDARVVVRGFSGHVTCLPFALFAAWRERLMHLWTPIVVTVGFVAAQLLQPLGSGLLIFALAMLALTFALARMDWRPRERAAGAAA